MFLLDDILFAPIKGLAAACHKIHEAAREDMGHQEKAVLASLAELHQLMDTGQIGDDAFDIRECELLDRLEACQKAMNKDDRAVRDEERQDSDDGI